MHVVTVWYRQNMFDHKNVGSEDRWCLVTFLIIYVYNTLYMYITHKSFSNKATLFAKKLWSH